MAIDQVSDKWEEPPPHVEPSVEPRGEPSVPESFQNRIVGFDMVPADQLQANPDNWRKHPQNQRDALHGSLSTLGWVKPVIVNQRTGYVVDGHERIWQALKNNDMVPVITVDLEPGEESLALAILDPLSEMAVMDPDQFMIVAGLVPEDLLTDPAIAKTLSELRSLAAANVSTPASDGEGTDAPADMDRADALRDQWGTEVGQVWQLGSHWITCGDCTDPDVIVRVLGNDKIDLVVTDPPYGVEYDGGTTVRTEIQGDTDRSLYGRALGTLAAFVAPHVALYAFYADGDWSFVPDLIDAGWVVRRNLVWNKNLAQYGALSQQYKQKHEPILYCHRKGSAPYWAGDSTEVTVWDIERPSSNDLHPTQKPPAVYERAIVNSSKPGDLVFDGFAGSGTILIAAHNTGRMAVGVELDPRFVAVAIQRWVDATGGVPRRDS